MTIEELFKWLTKPVEPVRTEVLTIEQAFARTFGAAATEARHVETEAASLIHNAEKDIEMIPHAIQSLIDEIKNALAAHGNQSAADAQTISNLHAESTAKDQQIATLTQQLADANAQITETEAALQAVVAAAPAPAQPAVVTSPTVVPPANGSASADVTA